MASPKLSILIGKASGPIIGGPTVDVYTNFLKSGEGWYLSMEDGLLMTNQRLVYPAGDRAKSQDLAEQVVAIRRAYQWSLKSKSPAPKES